MSLKSIVLLTAATVGVAGSALAHHSFAMFDVAKTIVIRGTVKEFAWVNPHSWLYVIAQKADGTSEEWALECSSPNMMIRWGWNARDLKPGDKVAVDIHPSRDGRHVGSVFAVYLADGRVLADPMGRTGVSGDDLARGKPKTPTQPIGEPLK